MATQWGLVKSLAMVELHTTSDLLSAQAVSLNFASLPAKMGQFVSYVFCFSILKLKVLVTQPAVIASHLPHPRSLKRIFYQSTVYWDHISFPLLGILFCFSIVNL